jgi:hypothetical protein
MTNKFENEKLVGVQIRAIAGDVSRAYRERIRELYSDTPCGDSCYKWHIAISSYFADTDEALSYIAMIQIAYNKGMILDECESWKAIVRYKMSTEFMQMMDKFTQIPQLAARDLSEKKEDDYNYNPWS